MELKEIALKTSPFLFWGGDVEVNENRDEVKVALCFEHAKNSMQVFIKSLVADLKKAGEEGFLKEEERQYLNAFDTCLVAVIAVAHGYVQKNWLAPKIYVVETAEGIFLQKDIPDGPEFRHGTLILNDYQSLKKLKALDKEVKERRAAWENNYEISYRLRD
jgi:hypothetical protein